MDHPDISPADRALHPCRYEVREFKSWSLTKVASSDLTIKEAEGPVLTGISGEVYVRKGGVGEWTKYDQTVLKPSDEVQTGKNSKATLVYPNGDRIDLGPRTQVRVQSEFELLKGKIRAWILKFVTRFEVKAGITTASVRGTEFTVSVDEDGTTTVMTLDGSVEVEDRTSHAGILLEAGQMVTVPKTPGGFTQQDMLTRVKAVQPESIDRWWEEDLGA